MQHKINFIQEFLPTARLPLLSGFLYNRIDEVLQIVKLIRLGKHAELFG